MFGTVSHGTLRCTNGTYAKTLQEDREVASRTQWVDAGVESARSLLRGLVTGEDIRITGPRKGTLVLSGVPEGLSSLRGMWNLLGSLSDEVSQ